LGENLPSGFGVIHHIAGYFQGQKKKSAIFIYFQLCAYIRSTMIGAMQRNLRVSSIESDTRMTNLLEFPKRETPAGRTLRAEKLTAYPDE
jgi:hypothetical protein